MSGPASLLRCSTTFSKDVGTWQEQLFLGPQTAGLSKQVIEELLIQKRLTAFHISFGSPKERFCPVEFSRAASLTVAISSGCITKRLISTILLSQPDFSASLPLPAPGQSSLVFCFLFCLPLSSSGAMETGWMSSSMTAYPHTTTSWSLPSPPSATSSGARSWKRPMQSKANCRAVLGSPARLCLGRWSTAAYSIEKHTENI